nr:hypothetical protein [Pseudomonas sp. s4]
MFAYYNPLTSYVVGFSNDDMEGSRVEISDLAYVLTELKKNRVAKVVDGNVVFEEDRALLMKQVRAKRKVLLEEADAQENKIRDAAIINGVEVDAEQVRSIAIYRKSLRDIVETNEIVWPQKPW